MVAPKLKARIEKEFDDSAEECKNIEIEFEREVFEVTDKRRKACSFGAACVLYTDSGCLLYG